MESELYEAAVKGNASFLRELLANDKLLLDRIMTGNHTETPLHIAAMLGHLEFVEEVLTRKAELARVQNSQGSTPLHLAVAKGYVDIVKSLLTVSPEICFVRDKYEKNPLHVAAMKGHVGVLDCLARARPEAAHSDVEHGETILHLCVKHNRLEALKLLIDIFGDDDRFINSTDDYGNTILHLAIANGQTKTMLFLINKGVDRNIENSRGFTAQGESDERKRKEEESDERKRKEEEESDKRKRKEEDNMHNMLMVVAILVAAIAFEAGRETKEFEGHMGKYRIFIACNTISFITSLSAIMILISGVPLGRRIPTWIVMLIMWVAITFTAATYGIAIEAFCPKKGKLAAKEAGEIAVLVWVGLMTLIFLYHVVHLMKSRSGNPCGCTSLQAPSCLSHNCCTDP